MPIKNTDTIMITFRVPNSGWQMKVTF